jgi:hypothetical protein
MPESKDPDDVGSMWPFTGISTKGESCFPESEKRTAERAFLPP